MPESTPETSPVQQPLSAATRPAAQGTLDRTPWFHLLTYCLDRALTGRLDVHVDEKQITSICLHTGHPAAVILQRRTEAGVETETIANVAQTVIDMFGLTGPVPYAYYDGVAAIPPTTPATPCDLLSIVWAGLAVAKPWQHVSATLAKLEGAPMAIDESRISRFATEDALAPLLTVLRAGPATLEQLVAQKCADPNTTGLFVYGLLVTKCVRRAPPAPPSSGRELGRMKLKSQQQHAAPRVVAEEAVYDRRFDPRSSQSSISLSDEARNAIASSIADSLPPPPSSASSPPRSAPPRSSSKISIPPSSRMLAAAAQAIPADLTEAHRARVDEVRARAQAISKLTYYEILDVKKDATKEQIQSAFLQLAKKWHPDRLPDPLQFIRDECSRVFSMLSEAHANLTDEKKRKHYDDAIAAGVGTLDDQRKVESVLEAANNYQKALIFLKKGDNAKAEELAKQALALDDEQADYVALVAWLSAQRPESQGAAWTLSAIESLTRAIKMNENCERAYFYRGSLYKRIDNAKAATADFRKSVNLNPRNLEAVREVRLFEMRGGESEPPPSNKKKDSKAPKDAKGGGFLGKLLKR